MKIEHLALYIDAPLQSWGYMSKFNYRTTLSFPTRSGILGLLCAASGIDRSDKQGLEKFSNMNMSIFTLKIGHRLVDYHTVGGGWSKKNNRRNIVPTSTGTFRTAVTRREYLTDSKFGIICTDQAEVIYDCAKTLQNPIWGVWFGRKSCIPASPIYQGIYKNRQDALQRLLDITNQSTYSRCVLEAKLFKEGTDVLMDNPADFMERKFLPRRITVCDTDEIIDADI